MRDPSNWPNNLSQWSPDNGNDARDNSPPARPEYPRPSGYPPPQSDYPGNDGYSQGPMNAPNYPPYATQRPGYPDNSIPQQPPYPAQPYANNGYPPQSSNNGYPPQQQPPWAEQSPWTEQSPWPGQPGPYRDSRPSGPYRDARPSGPYRGQGGTPYQEPVPSRPYRAQAAGPYRDSIPSGPYRTQAAAPGTGYPPTSAGPYREAMPARPQRDPSRAQPIYRPDASLPYRYRSAGSPAAPAMQQGSEAAYAGGQSRPARRSRKRGGSFPIEHFVLGVGIAALLVATTQPWGTNHKGDDIPLNSNAAYVVTAMIAGLSALLILLNKRMGLPTLLGCLTFFAVPMVLAAAIGGSIVLAQLPIVPPITDPSVLSSWDRGFYIWWGGILVVMVGLALELMMHRKKDAAGI